LRLWHGILRAAGTRSYIVDMEPKHLALETVSDDELLRRLGELVSHSRRIEADLVAHIGEVDQRQLFARFAFPSMFAYCTEGLHLSEAEAYRRITVARAARRHPVLLKALRDGGLHLSGMALLVPLVTAENCAALLERATHRTKREIEELVAELSPRRDAPALIRKLPQATVEGRPHEVRIGTGRRHPASTLAESAASIEGRSELVPGRVDPAAPPVPAARDVGTQPAAPQRPVLEALSPDRHKVQFTASSELRDKIERLTALMRAEIPDGDLAAVIECAVTEKIQRLETRRFAKTKTPRKVSALTPTSDGRRYIPATVRRSVHERDGGRCAFVDEQGRRCSERHRLEFHHRHPFAMGGGHDVANISLLCSAHNRHMAERDYGRSAVGRGRHLMGGVSP